MPKYKSPERLEELSMQSLIMYVCELGEQLMPMITQSYTLKKDLNEVDMSNTEEEQDIFADRDEDDLPTTNRRKSIELLRRNSYQQKKYTEILQNRVQFLHDIFEYNIPCYLYDRVCDRLFIEIPRMVERIKSRRTIKTTTGEFLSQVNVAVKLIEIVVGPYLTYCHFEEMPKIVYQVFYARLNMLSGLEYLNLGSMSGGWKTDNLEPTVLRGLQNMSNLRNLTLNFDCTDTILLTLMDCCPKLHTLDLTSSAQVNNDSVNIITQMKTLRCVNLYRTSVSTEGYVKLLLGLPELEDVGRYDDIGRCLEYIVDSYPKFIPFALRKFSSRFVTTRFLQILAEHCPKMQHVSIFFNVLICELTALIGINQLSDLYLLSCDFFSDQVRDVLAVKGCNLTHLHLEHVDQIDMNALMYISQYCPDLKALTIYNCELIESTSLYLQKPAIPPFMNLERLILVALCDEKHLKFLFSTCLRIKMIKCGTMVPTNDELLFSILEKNPMEHLEEFSVVSSTGLTIALAYKLVEICSCLVVLNEIEGWAKVTPTELEVFKTFVKTNNLAVNLESKRFRSASEELL